MKIKITPTEKQPLKLEEEKVQSWFPSAATWLMVLHIFIFLSYTYLSSSSVKKSLGLQQIGQYFSIGLIFYSGLACFAVILRFYRVGELCNLMAVIHCAGYFIKAIYTNYSTSYLEIDDPEAFFRNSFLPLNIFFCFLVQAILYLKTQDIRNKENEKFALAKELGKCVEAASRFLSDEKDLSYTIVFVGEENVPV